MLPLLKHKHGDALQYGFKKGYSCISAVFTLLNQLNTLSAEVLECTVLFDATKAFHKVLHNGIYNKLLKKVLL